VIDLLSGQFILRGAPENIRFDNGPEFVATAVQARIGAVKSMETPAPQTESCRANHCSERS